VTTSEHKNIFDEWLSEHKALIFKVIRAYAFTVMDKEDLFQEITIQVWHSIPAFRNESSHTTWIYRVSLNTAIKWINKEKKHQIETIDNVEPMLHENTGFVDERLTWLYEEISKLDAIDRSITLLMLDGFSYKEIANILGIGESNVGVKINRIKKHLITKSTKLDYHGI
jgi:RNA polymerase sigma-70 factor (ECF subfamily)